MTILLPIFVPLAPVLHFTSVEIEHGVFSSPDSLAIGTQTQD